MYSTRATSLARQVIASFDKIGTKAPKGLAEVTAKAVTMSEQSERIITSNDALAVAVTAALTAGADPARDPDVQREVTAQAIGGEGVSEHVRTIIGAQLGEQFEQQAEAIVDAWRGAFDQAVQTLADARSVLGTIDLDDTAAVVALGGTAAEAWGKARAGMSTVATIESGWLALAQLTSRATIEPRYTLMRIVGHDVEGWLDRELTGVRMDAWQAGNAGLTLRLSSPAEYRARAAEAVAEAERRVDRERALTERRAFKAA